MTNWYYSVELSPGERTTGHGHANVATTRALLRSIDLRGASCLDIGTQEAILPVLLKREGAGSVAAYDRLDLTERVDRVKRAYGAEFDYIPGIQLAGLPRAMEERGRRVVDVVVFSGVMYHMINPLGGLATARSFCRQGGLFLVETAAVQGAQAVLHFNAAGKLYGPHANFFLPTTACLDYFLRMLGLRPERACHIGSATEGSIVRLAVLCRSGGKPSGTGPGEDAWAAEPSVLANFREEALLHWERIASDAAPVPLGTPHSPGAIVREHESLHDWAARAAPYAFAEDETRLDLDSRL